MNEIEQCPKTPTLFHKLSFWLMVSAFSAFFAETCCGNEPFVLLKLDTWLFCVSMYGLHTLILGSLALRSGKTSFSALYFAGAIFGLYEAYMTKVLWAGWEPGAFKLGGVAIVETLMLVLFWHPFMAFIVPLFFVERFLLRSTLMTDAVGPRTQRAANGVVLSLVCLPIITGAFDGGALANIPYALISTIGSTAVLAILILLWTKLFNGTQFSLDQLLPKGKEFVIFVLLLLIQYIFFFFAFNPHNTPGFWPQFNIWSLYFICIGLFILALQRIPQQQERPLRDKPESISKWALFSVIFIISGSAASIAGAAAQQILFVVLFLTAVPYGCGLFIYLTYKILRLKHT